MSASHNQTAENVARAFHEAYERLAPKFNYKTREASAVPWEDVPAANKNLMIAVVDSLLTDGLITTAQSEPKSLSGAASPKVMLNIQPKEPESRVVFVTDPRIRA
ncbi:hypothetical protein AB0F88_40045 [Streptosporangium sp. NPDC023963]|uniref:hypothetical protein n=1 Tax=Streptosporangium sp. NPDC023963 TaxID=3155608 RepID=UPI00341C0375